MTFYADNSILSKIPGDLIARGGRHAVVLGTLMEEAENDVFMTFPRAHRTQI